MMAVSRKDAEDDQEEKMHTRLVKLVYIDRGLHIHVLCVFMSTNNTSRRTGGFVAG